MSDLLALTGARKDLAPVVRAIVREDASNAYPKPLEPRHGPPQEGHRRGSSLVAQHFHVGNTRSVVDGNMNELPARAATLVAAVSMHTVPRTRKANELLHVQVQQVPGPLPLVAPNRKRQIERPDA